MGVEGCPFPPRTSGAKTLYPFCVLRIAIMSEFTPLKGSLSGQVEVEVIFGPEITGASLSLKYGTLTALVPSTDSGTVIAGTTPSAIAPDGTLAWVVADRLLPAYGAIQAEAQSLQSGSIG